MSFRSSSILVFGPPAHVRRCRATARHSPDAAGIQAILKSVQVVRWTESHTALCRSDPPCRMNPAPGRDDERVAGSVAQARAVRCDFDAYQRLGHGTIASQLPST